MMQVENDEVTTLLVNALIKLNIFRFAVCDVEEAQKYLESAIRSLTWALKIIVEKNDEEFDSEIIEEPFNPFPPPSPQEPSL